MVRVARLTALEACSEWINDTAYVFMKTLNTQFYHDAVFYPLNAGRFFHDRLWTWNENN